MDPVLCAKCFALCPSGAVDGEEVEADQEDDDRKCGGCGGSVAGGVEVTHVTMPADFVDGLVQAIHACEQTGCGGGHYDSEERDAVGGDVNSYLYEVVYDHAASHGEEPFYCLLAGLAEDDHELARVVGMPDLACPGCGAEIDGWFGEVKTRVIRQLVPRLASPPPEIRNVKHVDLAASIEWARSDSSIYLMHLTRGQRIATKRDNIDYEDEIQGLSAPEILWSILVGRVISARKGKGMRAPAVCFTEKPLGAIKETILGAEARVRRGTRSLRWSAYGVMFEKSYLVELGVQPVLHLGSDDMAKVPAGWTHRLVSFTADTNWLHEREWRAGADVRFDAERCIVLVPTFEQASVFSRELDRLKIKVRGFLPLHDVFAAL